MIDVLVNNISFNVRLNLKHIYMFSLYTAGTIQHAVK